jgi:hypothetical protein
MSSARLQQAAFDYENLLLRAGALVRPEFDQNAATASNASDGRHSQHTYIADRGDESSGFRKQSQQSNAYSL